jgi:trk system potassium uptake protein TrkA
MKQHVVVIGLGRFGAAVATTLYQHGHTVLGVDVDEEKVDEVKDEVTHAVRADASDEETMRELGVEGYDVGIVCIAASVEASVMATLLLKRFGVAHVIAKAASHLHAEILRRIGADRVVFPEREMGIQVAYTFGAPQLEDYLGVSSDYGLSRVAAPAIFIGRTVGELDLRSRFGLTVILIRRNTEILLHPSRGERLQTGDQVVLAGRVESFERLSAAIGQPTGPATVSPAATTRQEGDGGRSDWNEQT